MSFLALAIAVWLSPYPPPNAQDGATPLLPPPGADVPAPPALDGVATLSAEDEDPEPRNYHVAPRSYSTRPIVGTPPRYARKLSEAGIEGLEGIDWIDVGLDFRYRYEHRDNDFRRPVSTLDHPSLYRTRMFFALREKLDPFRFTLELEDAGISGSQFPDSDREVNSLEPIQAFGELHFENALGPDRPFVLRGGRMAFEFVDRRLIGSNEWRNTTNTFQGLRASFGKQENEWDLETLFLEPLDRDIDSLDEPSETQTFFAAIPTWRRWSRLVTLQPYYMLLLDDQQGGSADRTIHTTGLRAYGPAGKTGFDYDLSGIYQFGESGPQDHAAYAALAEVGYTFDLSWKPRLAAFYGFVSGDRDPTDDENQRFERLFGFARPWSSNDYFQMENLSTPKLLLDFQPFDKTRIDMAYVAFWLASETDRWSGANLRDPTGDSGDFVGQEFNIRVRQQVSSRFEVNVGYAFFRPGEFARNLRSEDDSHFFYLQLSLAAF